MLFLGVEQNASIAEMESEIMSEYWSINIINLIKNLLTRRATNISADLDRLQTSVCTW